MKPRRHLHLVAGLLFLACSVAEEPASSSGRVQADQAASVADEAPPLPIPLSAEQAAGKRVFETVCWTCHGSAGRGDGPAVQAKSVPSPPDLTAGDYPRLTAADLQRRFRASFAAGDPEHPHMRFVRSLLTEETFARALAYVPALGYPAEVSGSAMAGRQIYAFRCSPCHGLSGDGKGIAASDLMLPPADLTRDTLVAGRRFELLFEKIKRGGSGVHGSSMPPWGVFMSDAEIWDLVAYVGTFQEGTYRPPAETMR